MAFGPLERAVFKVAREQHGVITYAQLAGLGVTKAQLNYRMRSGEWVRVLPSVARMFWAEQTWLQRVWAAWLWAGPLSVISHSTAGALNGLGLATGTLVHVSLPQRFRADPPTPWVRVHRFNSLRPNEVKAFGELCVTTSARTVVDLAAELAEPALLRLVSAGLRVGAVQLTEIHKSAPLNGSRGRRGVIALRRVLRTVSTATDRRQSGR